MVLSSLQFRADVLGNHPVPPFFSDPPSAVGILSLFGLASREEAPSTVFLASLSS